MQRIESVDPGRVEPRTAAILAAQSKKWGAPLYNHLIYARCPDIFRAVRGMWSGLETSGQLEPALIALVNRRVAFLNHCPF